jgi:hypothetical protein
MTLSEAQQQRVDYLGRRDGEHVELSQSAGMESAGEQLAVVVRDDAVVVWFEVLEREPTFRLAWDTARRV